MGGADIRQEFYLLMIFVPTVLINYIRNLKKLTPISLAANVLIILSFLGVVYYLVKGDWSLGEVRPITKHIKTLPLFMGTMMFALEAVGVVSRELFFASLRLYLNSHSERRVDGHRIKRVACIVCSHLRSYKP